MNDPGTVPVPPLFPDSDLDRVFRALRFAARFHKTQRRKDGVTPYINHPIDVAVTLYDSGGVRDAELLQAALLHDTIEDTDATADDLRLEFGEAVVALVLEVTDDKSLPKAQRKALQIQRAPEKSDRTKLLKLADKICNIHDITHSPPEWTLERMEAYLDWSEAVIAGVRGVNPGLERRFDETMTAARTALLQRRSSDR